MSDTLFTDATGATPGTLVVSSWLNDVNTDAYSSLTSVGGTADAITATGPLSLTAYAVGQRFVFIPTGTNTTNVTINISGLGSRAITKFGNTLTVAGDIVSGMTAQIVYDGAGFQLLNPRAGTIANGGTGATTASAALAALSAGSTLSFRNKIINGAFNINQRAAASGTSLALNAYFFDRWRSATATNAVTWASSSYGNILTIPATEEIEQIIEGNNIEGGVYTLSWTGTATAQVNGVAIANGGQTSSLPANTNVTIKFLAGTVSFVQFERNSFASTFEHRPKTLEELLCYRYYQTSYPSTVPPGTAGAPFHGIKLGLAGDTSNVFVFNRTWPVVMRTAPTCIAYQPTTGAGGTVRDVLSGASIGLSVQPVGTAIGLYTAMSAAAFTAGRMYDFHVTAEAEL